MAEERRPLTVTNFVTFVDADPALRAVAEPTGPWNWVFLGPDPKNLQLVDGGLGSVDQMRESLNEHEDTVLFGLLRLGFGVGRLRRNKWVFVHGVGAKAGAVQRAKLATARPQMQEVIRGYAVLTTMLEIVDLQDLNVENVIDRVRRAAVIDDQELAGAGASERKSGARGSIMTESKSVSVFSEEAFRAALEEDIQKAIADEAEEDEEEREERIPPPDGTFRDGVPPHPGHEKPEERYDPADKQKYTYAATAEKYRGTKSDEEIEDYWKNTMTLLPWEEAPEAPAEAPAEEVKAEPAPPPADPAKEEEAKKKPRISGPLLKQSSNWMRPWQLRWFEIRAGRLIWWESPVACRDNETPSGFVDLVGMKVARVDGNATQFTLKTTSGKDKTYLLDSNIAAIAKKAGWTSNVTFMNMDPSVWVEALQQEAAARGT